MGCIGGVNTHDMLFSSPWMVIDTAGRICPGFFFWHCTSLSSAKAELANASGRRGGGLIFQNF